MTETTFDREQYRRDRLRRLERDNEYLERDRDRLIRLLAAALSVAVGGSRCTIGALLELLEALDDGGVPLHALRAALDDDPEPPLGCPYDTLKGGAA